jgi:hypothetical protein
MPRIPTCQTYTSTDAEVAVASRRLRVDSILGDWIQNVPARVRESIACLIGWYERVRWWGYSNVSCPEFRIDCQPDRSVMRRSCWRTNPTVFGDRILL